MQRRNMQNTNGSLVSWNTKHYLGIIFHKLTQMIEVEAPSPRFESPPAVVSFKLGRRASRSFRSPLSWRLGNAPYVPPVNSQLPWFSTCIALLASFCFAGALIVELRAFLIDGWFSNNRGLPRDSYQPRLTREGWCLVSTSSRPRRDFWVHKDDPW